MLKHSRLSLQYLLYVGLVAVTGYPLATGAQLVDTRADVSMLRRAELVKLVRQDCGSCHGLTLAGGLGPALLPQNLNEKPDDYLKFVILQGRPGTPMPPWGRFLSDTDASWIVANLKQGFPNGH